MSRPPCLAVSKISLNSMRTTVQLYTELRGIAPATRGNPEQASPEFTKAIGNPPVFAGTWS